MQSAMSAEPVPLYSSAVVSLSEVPAYAWRHGCGPTALGMIFGYYDGRGFGDMMTGSAVSQTAAVNQNIASQGSGVRGSGEQRHFEDYSLPDDENTAGVLADSSRNYPSGCHPNDSIADFFRTSWSVDGNRYGWSSSSRVTGALNNYVASRNPAYQASIASYSNSYFNSFDFSVLVNEIDNNRPMLLLVDTDGNGSTDHFVTAVAYSNGSPPLYGCLDTWPPYSTIRWSEFRSMASGRSWGVQMGWSIRMRLPLTVAVVGDGSVGKAPNATSYDGMSDVVLTATPQAGRAFAGWTGDVPAGHENDNPLVITMDGPKSLTATFLQAGFFALQASAINGSVSKTPNLSNYAEGSIVDLTAVSDPGYSFLGWTGSVPGDYSADNPLVLTMSADKSVTAWFRTNISAPGMGGGMEPFTGLGINSATANWTGFWPSPNYDVDGNSLLWQITKGGETVWNGESLLLGLPGESHFWGHLFNGLGELRVPVKAENGAVDLELRVNDQPFGSTGVIASGATRAAVFPIHRSGIVKIELRLTGASLGRALVDDLEWTGYVPTDAKHWTLY